MRDELSKECHSLTRSVDPNQRVQSVGQILISAFQSDLMFYL